MNGRLQVGGLAMIIKAKNPNNLGVIVGIVSRGDGYDWNIEGELDSSHIPIEFRNLPFGANSDQLLPIGDKQTQDELAKEKEIDHV